MKLNKKLLKIKNDCAGVCQLCRRYVENLLCDHDHTTELIRGFVCYPCNSFLIPAGENRAWLVSDIVTRYLDDPPLGHLKLIYKNQTKEFHFGNHSQTAAGEYKDAFNKRGRFASIVTNETITRFTFKSGSGKISEMYQIEKILDEKKLMDLLVKKYRSGEVKYPSQSLGHKR
jgi:hypothetical protein